MVCIVTNRKKALFVIETIMDPGDFDPWGPRGFDDKATYYILSERANPDIWIILCTFILLLPIKHCILASLNLNLI